jgi:hypothetical protein
MMTEPAPRPTMNDLAAPKRPDRGLKCPQCAGRDFRVRKTVRGDGVILRRRECRHCGRRITTFEGP